MVTAEQSGGSVIVGAVALAVATLLIVATAAARTTGTAVGAAALADRAEARTSAEFALRAVLLDLESGTHRETIARGGPIDADGLLSAVEDRLAVGDRRAVTLAVADAGRPDTSIVEVEVRVGGARATARAEVRPWLTTDFALVTEHAASDPVLSLSSRADCTWPPGHQGRSLECHDPVLSLGAVDGPVHSNERLRVATGTTLHATVSSSSPDDIDDATSTAVATAPFGVVPRSPVSLPRTIADVSERAVVTCRFRGPTLIRFVPAGMRVTSPRSVPRPDDETGPQRAVGCLGVDRDALETPVTIELPESVIIEVVRDTDVACARHPLGIGADEDDARGWWCSDGDAFIWGDYTGRHTVLAEDNVQILWDLVAHGDDASHSLGVVAGDSIAIRRPVGPATRSARDGTNVPFAGAGIPPFGAFPLDAPASTPRTWDAPRIEGALAALRGSVSIQNPFRGERGKGVLQLFGSVAGRFTSVLGHEVRSPSGALLTTTGYDTDVRYNPRLQRYPPPAMPHTDWGRIRILSLEVG